MSAPGSRTHPGGAEVVLQGGTTNHGRVVRVGNTVRRPQRPTSGASAALLGHLADVGFDGAPRYLGVDEQGREVLSYVEGEAVTPPYPAWALSDEALVSVAQLLARYHAAVAGFDPRGRDWPKHAPAAFQDGIVSHNDPNLDNVVFRDGRAVALIDFDLSSPGSRLWDVAAAVRLWTPLRLERDVPDGRRGRLLPRVRTFLAAYGLEDADRARLADAVLANHDWCYDTVRVAVLHGHPAFTHYLATARDRAERSRQWYADRTGLRQLLG